MILDGACPLMSITSLALVVAMHAYGMILFSHLALSHWRREYMFNQCVPSRSICSVTIIKACSVSE